MSWFTKSVDSIVADITKKVEQLEAAVVHHNTQGSQHLQTVADLQKEADSHFSEAERAHNIAAKLTALISP